MLHAPQEQVAGGGLLAAPEHPVESGLAGQPAATESVEKPVQRNRLGRTFGEQLLHQIDPDEEVLHSGQRDKLRALRDENDLMRMIQADLDSALTPDIQTAEHIYGKLLMRKNEIPQIILTWRFFTISQCMIAIADCRKLYLTKHISNQVKVAALQQQVDAIKQLHRMIDRLTSFSKKVGCLQNPRVKPKDKPIAKATKAAPDFA